MHYPISSKSETNIYRRWTGQQIVVCLYHRVTSATWLGKTYLMYNPLSITTIWHPSMDTSAFVGAVGSSTIYQRIQKGSCLADLLGNVHTDLGPGCGSYSGPWTGSSRSHPWYGSPWKTLSQTSKRPLWKSRFQRRNSSTLLEQKIYAFGCIGVGKRNSFDLHHPSPEVA